MASTKLQDILMWAPCSLRDILARLERNACGIILLVDEARRLRATITDGDVRRAVLAGLNPDVSVEQLIASLAPGPDASGPVTAPLGTPSESLVRLMGRHGIRHIPLLDQEYRVAGLARLEDLVGVSEPMRAVVMAGGSGQRLRPLTEHTPKPMLPVGDQPLLSRLVKQLRDSGIERVSVTTHFLGERIVEFLGDGQHLGLAVDYVPEDEPLGTAGSLSLLERPEQPTLVINGDILTRLNFKAMLEFHQDYQADMTVAVKQYDVQVPYGVVECQGELLTRLVEKPKLEFFVLAGIYLLRPSVWDFLEPSCKCEMPELIERLIASGSKVVQFPVSEYWLDIGSLEHYERAQQDVVKGLV